MTCQDCKYFNPNIRIKPEWVNQGLCEKRLTNGYAEYPSFDCEICDMFEDKDGTYHDGTEHCPRCGKAVSEWGLCNECECVGNALDALNSWESVSKCMNRQYGI